MTTEREPLSGGTYNGFSGPVGLRIDPPPPRRSNTRKLLLGGIAGAVGLGLVFGFLARPDFGDDGRAREPMKPVTTASDGMPGQVVDIEINAPPPAVVAPSGAPLEVLSPEMVRAAPQNVRVAGPAPPVPVVRAPVPVPGAAREPAFAERSESRIGPTRPSFDCDYARSRSEQLVCSDSQLAQADRRLNRAYNRAIRAGVPPRELRAEQDDWLAIREDAARRSPDAVADVYEQRIRELNSLSWDDDEG